MAMDHEKMVSVIAFGSVGLFGLKLFLAECLEIKKLIMKLWREHDHGNPK